MRYLSGEVCVTNTQNIIPLFHKKVISHDPLQKIHPNLARTCKNKYENKIKLNCLKLLKKFYYGIADRRPKSPPAPVPDSVKKEKLRWSVCWNVKDFFSGIHFCILNTSIPKITLSFYFFAFVVWTRAWSSLQGPCSKHFSLITNLGKLHTQKIKLLWSKAFLSHLLLFL